MMLALAYPYLYFGQILKCGLVFLVSHYSSIWSLLYEHQDRDIEKLKFGHKDGGKEKEALAGLVVAGIRVLFSNQNLGNTPRLSRRFEFERTSICNLGVVHDRYMPQLLWKLYISMDGSEVSRGS
jgi:hypothetical protein